MATLAELKEQLNGTLTKARDVAAAAETETRDFSEIERGQLAGWMSEAKKIKDQLLVAEGDADIRAQIGALGIGLIDARGGSTNPSPTPVTGVQQLQNRSLGQAYLESPEYREFIAHYAPHGHIPDSVKGLQSRPAMFNALLTGDSVTSGGALVVPQQTGILVDALRRPLTIRDIITPGTTSSDTVEYVRVTSQTNAAAPVAEATATAGGSGVKPESAMALVKVTEAVKTIAHWIPATKRALSDAGQIRTLIDNFLRFGLEEELEDQMMTGSGVGENFTGLSTLATAATIQTQAWDTDIFSTTRKAKTKVRTVGRDVPNAYVLNPEDWERIDLLQDNEARYFAGGPFTTMAPRLWGLPVVESEAVVAGTGYVANFKQAVLWDREQASITISDSHSDFFIRNMVAVLGELRAAFGVLRPLSFVQMDLTA